MSVVLINLCGVDVEIRFHRWLKSSNVHTDHGREELLIVTHQTWPWRERHSIHAVGQFNLTLARKQFGLLYIYFVLPPTRLVGHLLSWFIQLPSGFYFLSQRSFSFEVTKPPTLFSPFGLTMYVSSIIRKVCFWLLLALENLGWQEGYSPMHFTLRSIGEK